MITGTFFAHTARKKVQSIFGPFFGPLFLLSKVVTTIMRATKAIKAFLQLVKTFFPRSYMWRKNYIYKQPANSQTVIHSGKRVKF